MKDKIKEIKEINKKYKKLYKKIEKLEKTNDKFIDIGPLHNGILVFDPTINQDEVIEVQDYITNLQEENDKYKNIIKILKHFGENSLGIIYTLKDNIEPTGNEWLNLIEYEKYLRELKGE